MVDEAGWELNHQRKIIDTLQFMRNKFTLLQHAVSSSVNKEAADFLVTESTQFFLSQLDLLLEESNYLFELSNSKQLMLIDTIRCIKQLEQEISELKLQKQ